MCFCASGPREELIDRLKGYMLQVRLISSCFLDLLMERSFTDGIAGYQLKDVGLFGVG